MVLGPRAPGQPRCPVETPEATRRRRAARVARNRKGAQMQRGEGTRKSPSNSSATTTTTAVNTTAAAAASQALTQLRPRPPKTKPKESKNIAEVQEQLKKAEDDLQKKNAEYDTVLITFETLNKELESVKEKLEETTKQFQETSDNLEESRKSSETQIDEKKKENEELSTSNESLTNELAATKIQLDEVTQEKKVLVDSLTKIVHPSGKPSAEKLAGLMTELWTERDIIFQEVKSDLSKTRTAKDKAQEQSQRDSEALKAALDPTKTKDHLIEAQKRSKMLSEERNKALIEIEKLKNEKQDLVIDNITLTNVNTEIQPLKLEVKQLKRDLMNSNDHVMTNEATIMVLEGEKEDLINQLQQMKNGTETGLQQVNAVSDEELEDLKRVLCEVRYLIGLSQDTPPEETVDRLQEEWHKREIIRRKYEDEDPIKVDKGMQVEIGDQGDAVNQLQKLLSEVQSVTGLSKNLSPEDSAKELCKAWEGKEKSYKNLMEREKKKETKRLDTATKKNKEQLQKLLSEVRSMAGLPEETMAEDSAEKLRQAWKKQKNAEEEDKKNDRLRFSFNYEKLTKNALEMHKKVVSEMRSIANISEKVTLENSATEFRKTWEKQESRCLKAKDLREKKKELLAKIKFLTESIETLTRVEPGQLSNEELIEELQNRDVGQSLKIDSLVAELKALEEYESTPKKDKIAKFRKTCMAIAKEANIKHKDKTKVPEFLTLFRKELSKQAELVTSLEKKIAKKTEHIEELVASLEEMGDELDKPSTSPKNKKKKKKFFRKIINKIAHKQTSDEKLQTIADQADTIRILREIQDLKHKQDREILAYRREIRDHLDSISSLKNTIDCNKDTIVELKYSLQQEKEIVENLHDCVRFFEERNPLSPTDAPRHHDRTMIDLTVVAQFNGHFQNFETLDRETDLKPFDERPIEQERYPLRHLGGGTYGEITIARLRSNNKCVVVKEPIVPRFIMADNRVTEIKANLLRTLKEAMIHEFFEGNELFPNIQGVLTLNNQTCLVLDFIGDHSKGIDRTLFNVIKQKDRELPLMKKKDVMKIARDIVEATEALHGRRLLHNDIKANNILLEKRRLIWRAILIDFGQASTLYFPIRKEYSEITRKLYEQGQVHENLAPEIVMRGRPTSYVSDIFSIGHLFRMMGRDCDIPPLVNLGDECCRDNQAYRPQHATEILPKIDDITFDYLGALRPTHEIPMMGQEKVPTLQTP